MFLRLIFIALFSSLSLNGFEAPVESQHYTSVYQALSPYAVKQETDASCSLATAAMLVNAVKALRGDNSPPFSQEEILRRTASDAWDQAIAQGGPGLTLDQFGAILRQVFQAFELTGTSVHVIHIDNYSDQEIRNWHRVLEGMATSILPIYFVVANFDMSKVVPLKGQVGHFSPIGDYDRERQRVFVLDVDPSIKRSYWVNERTFLKSMATIDTDGKPPKHRGFLIISW